MSIYNPIIAKSYQALASAVRSSTQTLLRSDIIDPVNSANQRSGINPESGGLIAYLNVTVVPGVDTVQLVLEEQDPASLTWTTVCATTATAVTGLVKLKLKQAIASVAATTTLVQAQDTLPAEWRIRVVHSAGTNFTYSLGVTIYA